MAALISETIDRVSASDVSDWLSESNRSRLGMRVWDIGWHILEDRIARLSALSQDARMP
jgi:hypothetical protein